MAPRDPTNAQISSRLSYQQNTPVFLQKLKNKMAGIQDESEDDDEQEFEYVGNGRAPIPKRPRAPIPERPSGDPGSADEDDQDEKPQVVVLKQGKHLTEREAENVRRKEKGLPPLPEVNHSVSAPEAGPSTNSDSGGSKGVNTGLSFSSSKGVTKPAKRKAIIQLEDEEKNSTKSEGKSRAKKKPKKEKKTLLSFGDDA
ncbi:hypothetical protein FA15DRAFT_698965 [Coprinopsis marcescibilis]|uniref:DUF4604 domain-containing protein n=1 Tax=Coprinopsis marcescibilis TaxID=230819 RepID=A0A5C3LCY2_COPMA|nr:hypothetical protein FA15DRAFT_698965 [Coprinopsis marcescibilis]